MGMKVRSGRFSDAEIVALDRLAGELGMSGSDTLRHCVRVAVERHDISAAFAASEERIISRVVHELVRRFASK